MNNQAKSKEQPSLPKVAIIVAMTKEHVIGSGKTLPWHLPEDMALFKQLTTDSTVIMGHKTYLSIGSPLPQRHNIVLSRSQEELPGVCVCGSFMSGLISASQWGQPIYIIGGEDLYRKALPIASELHISWVNDIVPGDVFFPKFDIKNWTLCEESNHQGFLYCHYKRKNWQDYEELSY